MQEIHLVGINHKTSKVSDRERFIVDDSNLVYLNDFLISKYCQERKKLANFSKTPGRTRQLNFFKIETTFFYNWGNTIFFIMVFFNFLTTQVIKYFSF